MDFEENISHNPTNIFFRPRLLQQIVKLIMVLTDSPHFEGGHPVRNLWVLKKSQPRPRDDSQILIDLLMIYYALRGVDR